MGFLSFLAGGGGILRPPFLFFNWGLAVVAGNAPMSVEVLPAPAGETLKTLLSKFSSIGTFTSEKDIVKCAKHAGIPQVYVYRSGIDDSYEKVELLVAFDTTALPLN